MTGEGQVWTGGCLCGGTRYEVDASPRSTSLCHCEDCRRASGAPIVAWTFFPADTLRWTAGVPRMIYHSGRERTFCPDCGTPLTFFDPALPAEFEVTTCSLDDPAAAPAPADHNWVVDQLPWLQISDGLPRFDHNTV